MLWTVLDGTALEPGAAFFPALVRHLASALVVRDVFVAAYESIGTCRQVRHRVSAVCLGGDGADETCVNLGHRYGDAWKYSTAFVLDDAADLSGSLRPEGCTK